MPQLKLTYGLNIAALIDRLYYEDEFAIAIAYGGFLGTGKSSYCIKAQAEALGSHSGFPENIPDYKKVKAFIDYHPKGFVDRVLHMKRREKCDQFDDMGLWLFALDWYNPFVKAVVKYLNVARTDWGMILGNTPSPKMVVGFIQNFPEIIRVKIIKRDSNLNDPSKPRIAKAYQVWCTPDLKKTGVRKIFEDHYHAMLPDDFYEWYKPLRDAYAGKAKLLMQKELSKLHGKDKENEIEKGFKEVVPIPERIRELEEVIQQLGGGAERF